MNPARGQTFSVMRAVLATELRSLLRDRRALFTALVLPVILYPFMFLAHGWLLDVSQETIASRTVRIGYDLSQAPDELAERLRSALAQELPLETLKLDAAPLIELYPAIEEGAAETVEREKAEAQRLIDAGCDALIVAQLESTAPDRVHIGVYYDGTSDLANEAKRRIRTALRAAYKSLHAERIDALLESDPAEGLSLDTVDVANQTDTSGALLGGILPLIAIFVLFSGGSYAALSAFAGEREGGTLETLLVQPVKVTAVVWGKLGAILATGIVTLICNTGSLLACGVFGLGTFQLIAGEGGLSLSPGRVALGAAVFLPAVILLSSFLALVVGRARSFREGQVTLMPLMLMCALPALPALQSDVDLDIVLGAIPLTGPALALRDALRGNLNLPLALWAAVASAGWTWIALSRLAGLLDAESVLQSTDADREGAQRKLMSQRALHWGWFAVLAMYVAGTTLQGWHLTLGLALTLWGLLPLLTFFAARSSARRAGTSWFAELNLRLPHPAHAAAAVLSAPLVVAVVMPVVEKVRVFLPMPVGEAARFEMVLQDLQLGPWLAMLLFAVSPGITEELFFRGAILSGLRRDLSPLRCAGWQAALFAAVHLSIYRVLPTAMLGVVLTFVTLRARSLWPAILLHASYNALILSQGRELWTPPTWLPWVGILGLALWFVPARGTAGRGR